jgi:ribose transport system substrate-binding protein
VLRAADILKAFSNSDETLELRVITERTGQSKATAFRLAESLVYAGLLTRISSRGYRLAISLPRKKRFRIGYAAQSNVTAFTATVTESIRLSASSNDIDLLILNNRFSAKTALRNAEAFVREGVDLVIDSQINVSVASEVATIFREAHIPFIAVDIPHPSAHYFGADNYKAGKIAGRYLARQSSKLWQEPANEIFLLAADAAGTHLNARLRGMYDGLVETNAALRPIRPTHLNTKGQFDLTLDAMRKVLRRRKLRRILVGGVNDTSALAALQAFRDYGMEEECAIIGQDGCFEAREELRRDGTRFLCSTAFHPEKYGAGLIDYALNILNGKTVPPAIFIEHELLTRENVGKLYPNDDWIAHLSSP